MLAKLHFGLSNLHSSWDKVDDVINGDLLLMANPGKELELQYEEEGCSRRYITEWQAK